MYSKNISLPEKASHLKEVLSRPLINNPDLVEIVDGLVSVKVNNIYSKEKLINVIQAINDDNRNIVRKVSTERAAAEAIFSDKGRLNEAPGNYLIISNEIYGSNGFHAYMQGNDHAFVIIYRTDESHERHILLLCEVNLSGRGW